MKLDVPARYLVMHDPSTLGADWSRDALHDLVESTVATVRAILRARAGDRQDYERRERSGPSRGSSHGLYIRWEITGLEERHLLGVRAAMSPVSRSESESCST